MADDDTLPRRAVEEQAPSAKERGVAFRHRVGRLALPSVLILAVSAGLAFSGAASSIAGSDGAEAAPAAPALHVDRGADQLSRSAVRIPVIDRAAGQENLPAAAPEAPAAPEPPAETPQPAEPQVINADAFTPAVAKATEQQFAAATLNIRAEANAGSERIGKVDRSNRVGVTGATANGFHQVEFDGRNGWVSSEYLSKTEPARESAAEAAPATPGGGAACKVSLPGLTSRTTSVHQALCANFPAITSYGGVRPDSDVEHPAGRAIDAMVSSTATGDAVANWARANAAKLGITEVIWNQRIWTTQRGSEGWRAMGDRGSVTANHGDHVHISVG